MWSLVWRVRQLRCPCPYVIPTCSSSWRELHAFLLHRLFLQRVLNLSLLACTPPEVGLDSSLSCFPGRLPECRVSAPGWTRRDRRAWRPLDRHKNNNNSTSTSTIMYVGSLLSPLVLLPLHWSLLGVGTHSLGAVHLSGGSSYQ